MFQTPINPMAAQFGIYGQPSQTAAAPAQSTFTVGDAAKKKRIAEALRGKVSQGYEQMAPTGHVEGFGAFPGQSYVNWGGILSNAAQPWLEGRREEQAVAAEDEAAAAQQSALDQILGGYDPQKGMTMEQAIQLGELTGQDYTKQVRGPAAPGAILQAMGTGNVHPEVAAAVARGESLSPELIALQQQYLEEQIAAKNEHALELQRIKKSGGGGGGKVTVQERLIDEYLRNNLGSSFTDAYVATKQLGTTTKPDLKAKTDADYDEAIRLGDELVSLANNNETFSTWNRLGKTLKDTAGQQSDGVIGSLMSGSMNWLGSSLENEQGLAMNKFAMDNVIGRAKELYPVSNADMRALVQAMPTVLSDQAAVKKFAAEYARVARAAKANAQQMREGRLPPNFDYASPETIAKLQLPAGANTQGVMAAQKTGGPVAAPVTGAPAPRTLAEIRAARAAGGNQ